MLAHDLRIASLSPYAAAWLERSPEATVLNAFDHACNLVNENREVMALVTPSVGNGPFHAVLDLEVSLHARLEPGNEVHVAADVMRAGPISIKRTGAKLWSPQPDWDRMRARRAQVLSNAARLEAGLNVKLDPGLLQPGLTATQMIRRAGDLANQLCAGVATGGARTSAIHAGDLAGLGPGSTPSGDDFILGAMYAGWALHLPDTAHGLARAIVEEAVPRTTSLSAAWLHAGARGEAGEAWHDFLAALASDDAGHMEMAATRIMRTGASSGEAALAGFLGVMHIQAEREQESWVSLNL